MPISTPHAGSANQSDEFSLLKENRDFGSLLVATLILIQFLTTVKLLVWSFFALVLPRGSPLGYEQVVRFTFDFLCIYELQFFGATCLE